MQNAQRSQLLDIRKAGYVYCGVYCDCFSSHCTKYRKATTNLSLERLEKLVAGHEGHDKDWPNGLVVDLSVVPSSSTSLRKFGGMMQHHCDVLGDTPSLLQSSMCIRGYAALRLCGLQALAAVHG